MEYELPFNEVIDDNFFDKIGDTMDVHARDSQEVEAAADPRDVQTALLVPNSIEVAVGTWEVIGNDGDLSGDCNGAIERNNEEDA